MTEQNMDLPNELREAIQNSLPQVQASNLATFIDKAKENQVKLDQALENVETLNKRIEQIHESHRQDIAKINDENANELAKKDGTISNLQENLKKLQDKEEDLAELDKSLQAKEEKLNEMTNSLSISKATFEATVKAFEEAREEDKKQHQELIDLFTKALDQKVSLNG